MQECTFAASEWRFFSLVTAALFLETTTEAARLQHNCSLVAVGQSVGHDMAGITHLCGFVVWNKAWDTPHPQWILSRLQCIVSNNPFVQP